MVEGCVVVVVGGEIDVASAPALRRALMDGVATSARVVVDVSAVTFLDCAGLSVMVTALGRAHAHRGALRLVGTDGVVGRLLALTRLDRAFVVCASVDDAVASMGGAGAEP